MPQQNVVLLAKELRKDTYDLPGVIEGFNPGLFQR